MPKEKLCNYLTKQPQVTEERYLATIHNKTGKLLESAALLGAVTGDKHLGTSFQLIDDALDYMSDVSRLGKNIGDDLAEGKPTLPLLYAMWNGSEKESKLIENAIRNGGLGNLDEILKTIENTGGLSYTFSLAEKEAKKALASLAHLPFLCVQR